MRLLCGFALELVLAFVRHCGRLLALAHSLVLLPLHGLDEQLVLLPRHTILTIARPDARLIFLAPAT